MRNVFRFGNGRQQRIRRLRWFKAIAIPFVLGLSLAIASCTINRGTSSPVATSPAPVSQTRSVRIGHQKFDPFTLVKARKGLEKRLEPLGVSVEWTEFQSGPPLLEALNVGSIDIGRTGDAPPVIAQAAGTLSVGLHWWQCSQGSQFCCSSQSRFTDSSGS